MKNYPHLFSPLQVGTITLKNRIALAPMSFTKQHPDGGYPTENVALVEEVARGGAGLITLGESVVGTSHGKTHVDMTMLGDPRMLRSYFQITEAAHRYGAKISVEVSHGGAFSPPAFNNGQMPMGPSKYPNDMGFNRGDGEIVVPMTLEMMEDVANEFANSVEILKNSGFDMAQIHFGHGWLIHQFLSPLFNRRDDEYGGSLENRLRFPLMVLDRIRERVGRSFPLDIRISGCEPIPGGLELEEVVEICKAIESRVDMISVSCGGVHHAKTAERMSPQLFLPRGVNVYLAEAVRKAVSIPVSTVGALAQPTELEKIIAGGRADVVYMARALVADHDLPKKAMQGREDEILHCIRCNYCQDSSARQPQRLFRCSINPTVGFEGEKAEWKQKAAVSKNVVIVGGGPCGMQAALTAAERGHKVTLYEKSDRLGGALSFADYVSFKSDIRIFRDRMAHMVLKNPNITVHMNTEMTPERAAELNPDALLVAIGAEPIVPPIPGVDGENVVFGCDVSGHESRVGQKVVMLGGGLIGAETAIHLAMLGREVVLVEMTDKIARDAAQAPREAIMHQLTDRENIQFYTNTRCTEITPTGVKCLGPDGEVSFACDTVVLAAGMKGLTAEAYTFGEKINEFRVIGDANKAGKILNATRDGFFAAIEL